MGRDAGLDDAKLAELADFDGDAPASATLFGEVERCVLRYADGMTDTPVDVSDELFAELRGHLEEIQIVELTSAFAWEHYRARFDHALGVESEGFSEGAFCPVPPGSPR